MNKLQIFGNTEFGELEIIKINNKPYFPATKCAETLRYTRPHNGIANTP